MDKLMFEHVARALRETSIGEDPTYPITVSSRAADILAKAAIDAVQSYKHTSAATSINGGNGITGGGGGSSIKIVKCHRHDADSIIVNGRFLHCAGGGPNQQAYCDSVEPSKASEEKPLTMNLGKTETWTMPPVPESDLEVGLIDPWPKGGQQVGVRPVQVKMLHRPTGIYAVCGDERSQHKNRTVALRMVEYGLAELRYSVNPTRES